MVDYLMKQPSARIAPTDGCLKDFNLRYYAKCIKVLKIKAASNPPTMGAITGTQL